MSHQHLDDLVERVRVGLGARDPATVALAIRVATDLAMLQGQVAMGQDVEDELKIARASALNLTEHARDVVGREVLAFVQGILARVIS